MNTRFLIILLALLGLAVLLAGGCAKAAKEAVMQEATTAAESPSSPSTPVAGEAGGGRMMDRGMGGPIKDRTLSAPAPAEGYDEPAKSTPSPTGAMASQRRKVIMTGDVTLEVRDVEESGKRLSALVNELGGFISGSSFTRDPAGGLRADVTLRIPQERFDQTVAQIEKLGTVENKNLQGEDVTAQFVDLQARLKSRKIHEERVLTILRNAAKLDDLLRLEQELARIRSEIEQMEGQLRYLSDQVALSTITVHLHGHTPVEVSPTPTDHWSLRNVVNGAVRSFVVIGRALIGVVVWLVILSPFWLVLPVALWYGLRGLRRKLKGG